MADVICVGAPRAGTTWLFENLRHHAGVFVPDYKELNFFRARFPNDGSLGDGDDAYARFFQGADGRLRLDVSPDLLSSPHAARYIGRVAPSARILVMLRDPVDRAVSHYNYLRNRRGISYTPHELLETRVGFRILEDGLYGHHLTSFLREFARDRIHVELTANVRNEPERLLERVQSFMGLNVHVEPPKARRHVNAPSPVRSGFVRRLQRKASQALHERGHDALRQKLTRTGLPDALRRLNTSGTAFRWVPSSEERASLRTFYREDTSLLEELLERRLPWSTRS